MKLLNALLFCFLSFCAFALFADPQGMPSSSQNLYERGLYIGVQTGYMNFHNTHADVSWGKILFPLFAKSGSRAFAGINFNDYTAIEAGYDYLAHDEETGGLLQRKNHTYVSGFDILGKGTLPVNSWFSVFAKVGEARIHQDILNSYNNGQTIDYQSNTRQWMMVASPGIELHFFRHLALDGYYTRFFKKQEIQNIDMVGLGLSFTF
jgi:hypothetical protein